MKGNKIMLKTVMEYALMSIRQAERMPESIKKSIAETIFQEQQLWNTAMRPVLYGRWGKAKNDQPGKFQPMYGVVSMMNGDELSPISRVVVTSLCREMEVAATLSLRISRSKQQHKQLKLREGLPEQRFKVGDKVLVAKKKALSAIKAGAFQTK